MVMEVHQVQHLGHDHPLMLIKAEETDDSWDLSCYGCEQPILGLYSYYGCKRCVFFLHKTCAELPFKMTHYSHPQHALTLLPNPTSLGVICDVCDEYCKRFVYHCHECDFDIDFRCALVVLNIQQSIEHTSHPHQLTPVQKESMFLCEACGIKHEGTSFLCTTCGFWINQKCASSPINLKLINHHDHTLSLFYFIPQEAYQRDLSCEICSMRIYRRGNWVYCCSKCRYLVHLHCALSEETKNGSHDLGLNTINLSPLSFRVIHLPVPDDSADIITQFIKNIAIQGKHEEASEIKHCNHDHPLTLSEKPIDHALSLSDGATNDEKCIGCTQSISAPFYHCLECKFFLHVWCAKLPEELRHPAHPQHTLSLTKIKHRNHDHPLTLSEKPIDHALSLSDGATNDEKCIGCTQSILAPFYHCLECKFFLHVWCAKLPEKLRHPAHPQHTLSLTKSNAFRVCKCCNLAGDVLFYSCELCDFFLDCKCASLPRVIKHESHDKHTLALRPTFSSTCISCSASLTIAFECWGCKFTLCGRCATNIPRTVRHIFDKRHALTLTYSRPPYTKDGDFFCEICEVFMDSSTSWFYHCGECNQYHHTVCIFPVDKCSK